jgi:hypothetical protein
MNNLVKYEDEIQGDIIQYDDAVLKVKTIDQKYQWILGEIASKLEPKYGERTLERFAEDIGRNFNTLKGYQATYLSWKTEKVVPLTFSVAQKLNPLPSEKKQEILEENPNITRDEARAVVKEFKKNLFEKSNNIKEFPKPVPQKPPTEEELEFHKYREPPPRELPDIEKYLDQIVAKMLKDMRNWGNDLEKIIEYKEYLDTSSKNRAIETYRICLAAISSQIDRLENDQSKLENMKLAN